MFISSLLEKELAIAGGKIVPREDKYKVLQDQNKSLQTLVNDQTLNIGELEAMNSTQTDVAMKLENMVSENTLKHENEIKRITNEFKEK